VSNAFEKSIEITMTFAHHGVQYHQYVDDSQLHFAMVPAERSERVRGRSQVTVLIGLDLSAAFDTVDHRLLLDRLQLEFGVTAAVLSRRPDPVYQGGPARITRH